MLVWINAFVMLQQAALRTQRQQKMRAFGLKFVSVVEKRNGTGVCREDQRFNTGPTRSLTIADVRFVLVFNADGFCSSAAGSSVLEDNISMRQKLSPLGVSCFQKY